MYSESFKVYDYKNKKWITDECVLASNGSLFRKIKKLFGKISLELISTEVEINKQDSRFFIYRCTNMFDCNNTMIFEGEILKSSDGVMGIVNYSNELGAYILLDHKNHTYYMLGQDVCKNLENIGSIIENPDLIIPTQRSVESDVKE